MWGTPHSSRWIVTEVASDRASTAGSAKSRVVAGVSSNARNSRRNSQARIMDRALLQRRRDRLKIATTSESTAEGIGRLHTLRNDQTKNIRRLQPPAQKGICGGVERRRVRSRLFRRSGRGGGFLRCCCCCAFLLEFLERVFERVEQPRDARSRHEDAARYGRDAERRL